MAKDLNKTRIRDTRYAVILSLLLVLFTREFIGSAFGEKWHALFDVTGSVLVSACVVGRIYCTAFLGGHKNAALITYGPFSMCRNPLYFCSFIGACGIALMSNHIILMFLLPALFCLVYFRLIAREEVFLISYFGEPYRAYCHETPRFFPRFSGYHAPESVSMYPQFLRKGMKDSLLWLLAFPFFECIEYLQDQGIIQPLFMLY